MPLQAIPIKHLSANPTMNVAQARGSFAGARPGNGAPLAGSSGLSIELLPGAPVVHNIDAHEITLGSGIIQVSDNGRD